MRLKSQVLFDELDVKCIEELPIILDVLASTGNKISRIFNPLFNDLTELINSNTPKGWQLDKRVYQNSFYPLTSGYGRDKIQSLETHFQIENSFTLVKKKGIKWENYFDIGFGFYYSKNEENSLAPYYYFNIDKPTSERYQGKINSLSFYKNIEKKVKDYNLDIFHPEKGDEKEFIELYHHLHSVEKIEAAYNIFKSEILMPFLNSVNDTKR